MPPPTCAWAPPPTSRWPWWTRGSTTLTRWDLAGETWKNAPIHSLRFRLFILFRFYLKCLQDNRGNFKHICVTMKYLSVKRLLVTCSWSVTLSQLVTLDLMTILWLARVQQLEEVRARQEGVLRTAEDRMREEHSIQDTPREEIFTTRHRLVGWQQWFRYLLVW